MKKSIASLAILMTFLACQKVKVDIPVEETIIEVSLQDTKATISDSGSGAASFFWEIGDDIGVVAGDALRKFTLTSIDGGAARFAASLPEGVEIENNSVIAYPYIPEDYSGGVFALSFPLSYTSTSSNSYRLRWAGKLVKTGDRKYVAELNHQTGIVRVTYNGVPADADAVTLTADKALADNSNTVTINFTWHSDGEMSFFFPVPAGNYNSFTAALCKGGERIPETQKTLSGSTMTVNTGYIYRLPVINLSLSPSSKTLVVYYSYTGNCRAIVTSLTEQIEADVLEIQPSEEGLKYEADNYKIGSELIAAIRNNPNDASSYPGIKPVNRDASLYETIIVVTPLWWSNMAAIMQSYLFQNEAKMAGKNIGLIVSSHSSGISGVESDAKRLIPEGKFYDESLWINAAHFNDRVNMIKDWLAANQKITSMTMNITAGGKTITATLADNATAKELAEKLKAGAVTVQMKANGFEHYGPLGFSLTSHNEQVTAVSGDIMLYNSNNICVFYGNNSWSYTPLGKVDSLSAEDLKAFFGTGDISVTYSLKQ